MDFSPLADAMPSLILYLPGESPQGGTLSGRVLIGRWSVNTIVIDDQLVSRIHAWITEQDGDHFITDGASFNGTLVNQRPVSRTQRLRDGDMIRIGPAEMTYHDADRPPIFVEPLDLAPRNLRAITMNGGFFVDCPCGAPLLVRREFLGKVGRCRFCGSNHVLTPSGSATDLLDFAEADESQIEQPKKPMVCSICQTRIRDEQVKHVCPSCSLAYHEECWIENRGCAAYGCVQVGVLDRPAEESVEQEH